MSSPSGLELPPQIQELLSDGPVIRAMSYMSAIAITVLLWDHALTFSDEVDFMWCRPFTLGKFLYFTVRYLGAIAQTMTAIAISGIRTGAGLTDDILTKRSYRGWLVMITVGGVVTLMTSNYVSVRHIYALWDHRRRILHILIVGWVLTCVCSLSFAIPAVMILFKTVMADNMFFHICVTPTKPKIWAGIWAPQVGFAIFIGVMTIINASGHPRRLTVKITTELLQTDILWTLSHIVIAVQPAYILMIFFFEWSIAASNLSRLLIEFEKLKKPRRKHAVRILTGNDWHEMEITSFPESSDA
ncbi:hypothetical protein OF83DRAFT_1296036 [Amylostereum chailletii]|nr:hypothetical protein OF83DRAFT_1296036 [Amylostereum chailletii]